MDMPIWSPQPVMNRTLQLEEVNKRLEKMLAEVESEVDFTEQHSTGTLSEHYAPLDQNIPCDDGSAYPTLYSDQPFTNSTSSPFPSFPENPEYIAEQAANEEMMAQSSFQGDIIPDTEAVYPVGSNDAIRLENQSLFPLDDALGTFSQHPPTCQHPLYDLCQGTNTLNGMNVSQTTGIVPTPVPVIDNQAISAPQIYKIEQMPTLVPVTNQVMNHTHTSYSGPYVVSTTINTVTTHYISTIMPTPTVAPFATMEEETTNPALAEWQQHTTIGSPETEVYSIPAPNIFLDSMDGTCPPQEQETLPAYCRYSSLSGALGP